MEQQEQQEYRKVDLEYITLDFEMPRIPAHASEPGDYSQEISGRIFAPPDEDDGDDRIEIGTLSATIVQVGRAIDEGCPLFDVFDAPSSATADCLGLFGQISYSTLSIDGYEYNERVQKLFQDDVWVGDILLVERIEVHPPYRGEDVGLVAMRALIDVFGRSCALVVCKPFPLQYSCKVDPSNQAEFKTAIRKLKKYWTRAGFKRVPKTDLYALAPHHGLPPIS